MGGVSEANQGEAEGVPTTFPAPAERTTKAGIDGDSITVPLHTRYAAIDGGVEGGIRAQSKIYRIRRVWACRDNRDY